MGDVNSLKTDSSVLKRKFCGDLKARRFLIQMKEITTKIIVCNIHTFLLFLIIELFYRAIKSNRFNVPPSLSLIPVMKR